MPQVEVYGVPSVAGCREETSEVMDQAEGPAKIRALYRYLIEGFDLAQTFTDCGDIGATRDVATLLQATERAARESHLRQALPFFLGGAHTLTLGALRGVRASCGEFSLIYVDAHPDLMPRPEINYGSTLYHALNEGTLSPSRIGFVGIRMIERPEAQIIGERGIKSISTMELEKDGIVTSTERLLAALPAPYYLSIDLDAIDPSLAPGVTTPTPIGLSPREVLALSEVVLAHPVVGADIVELSPAADERDKTARIAAALLRELTQYIQRSLRPFKK